MILFQIVPLMRLMYSWEFLKIVYKQHMHVQRYMQLSYVPKKFFRCLIHLLKTFST